MAPLSTKPDAAAITATWRPMAVAFPVKAEDTAEKRLVAAVP
jgi:hypothetical protein